MSYEVFWCIISAIVVFGIMIVTVAFVIARSREKSALDFSNGRMWHVELWNIYHGYRVDLHFANTLILGRTTLYNNIVENYPSELDATVSREHCMFYEQDGMLLAWNLSAVNPAAINGLRLNQPRQLMPGARLELGNSVFLITRVECIQSN